MRVLGVDYGLRRIGLAIGETEVGLAFARDGIESRGIEADAEALLQFAQTEQCERIVLGLPRLDYGHEGEQAAVTRQLGAALDALGADVAFADERYSTSAAKRNLSHLDSRRAKAALDSEAARIILETYLKGC